MTLRFVILVVCILGQGWVLPVSAQVIPELRQWLAQPRDNRPPLHRQPFATQPLSRRQACIRETLAAAWQQKTFTAGSHTFKFETKTFGAKPADGRSLYISLHGGGGTAARVNDQQWRNQLGLYTPAEGLYLVPRAPTDTWNMWHQAHIDDFLDQVIQAAVVLEEVNPNKVYLLGYSAGGDGVFQLAPRLADRWAAAAMMAGHPGDAAARNLRNIGFTIHMGSEDAAYKRNAHAMAWRFLLDSLQQQDPEGYPHAVHIHDGQPHWMSRRDSVALPWMARFRRQALPAKVVWQQDDVVKDQFYWLGVPVGSGQPGHLLTGEYRGNEVRLTSTGEHPVLVYLNDAMLNLNKPVTVRVNGQKVFKGKAVRTVALLYASIERRTDPSLAFSARILIQPGQMGPTVVTERR